MNSDVKFTIDEKNKIIQTNDKWDCFALENGAEDLIGRNVIGQSVFQHIIGESTQMYVRVIFDYARTMNKPVVREYRCDSDTLKRFMQMRVIPVGAGRLLIENTTIKVESISPNISFSYNQFGSVVRCSNCNRIQADSSRWLEVEQAYLEKLIHNDNLTLYAICPDCQKYVLTR